MSTYIMERDSKGRISKLKTEDGDVTIWTDISYGYNGEVIYKRETYVDKDYNIIDIFEQFRSYHNNGELKEIRSNKGVTQRFDTRGIPTV